MTEQSREITDIFADIAKDASKGCVLAVPDLKGGVREIDCPEINYIYGNSQYVKDHLDLLSKTPRGNDMKFPLVALLCPVTEQRGVSGFYSKAKLRLLIACSTTREWSNEQRAEYSFRNILRPIYRNLIAALRADRRISVPYDGEFPHKYSENYSYGRYGAFTSAGDEVSEPIDAINITDLEITVKNSNCRFK